MLAKWYALAITLALAWCCGAALAKPPAVGTVAFLKGAAAVRADAGAWTAVKDGSSLHRGDHVRTGKKSRIEIHLVDSSIIRLGSNTTLKIDTVLVVDSGEREITSSLLSGQAYA